MNNRTSRRWSGLAVMLVALFLAAFDFNVVNIAVPSIQRDLGATFGQIQLVIDGYALSYAVLLITGGRLGDIYGRRRVVIAGMAGFTIASALCAFATSPGMLIGSRVFQGAFAAMMVPQALSFIQVNFTREEQPKAYGAFGMMVGFGMIAGQLLGGLLVSANVLGLQWRPIFFINLPIGAAAIAGAWWLVPESRAASRTRLDVGGVVLVSAALVALIYPLIRGPALGWPLWAFASLAMCAVLLFAFVELERRQKARGGSPLGVAAIGSYFLRLLGARPASADYTHALTRSLGLNLALLGATAALAFLLPRSAVDRRRVEYEPRSVTGPGRVRRQLAANLHRNGNA